MARMKLRRVGMTGQAATLGLLALCGTAAPLTWETGPYAPGYLAVAIAHADSGRGGDDGGDSGRGGDDDGGRSDSSGSDDGDGSGSGSGRDRDGGDDGSGSDSSGDDGGSSGSGSLGGGDDSGSGGGDDGDGRGGDDDSGSDGDDDGSGSGSGGSGGDDGRDAGRPRATVELDDRDVAAVLRGERVLVDDLGRVLELELEIEHGRRTVTVKPHGGDFKRSPGPIGEVHSIPAAGVPASRVVVDRRTGALEVEVEHGVAVTKPHGGGRPAGLRDPVQVGSDLTSAEEAALIQGGWR